MDLFMVQESAQEVAEAISAVLNVDVTIVDSRLKRVAATGRYRDFIGDSLPENCSFETIYRSKKAEFIDKPNKSYKCSKCSSRGSCYELATIGYPIMNEDSLVGIIGLVAFTEEQRVEIEKKFDSLIVFLGKLGDLLAGNLKYNRTISALRIQDEETKEIVNGVRNGIICCDEAGNIKFINNKIEEYFKKDRKEIIGENISCYIENYSSLKTRETREIKIRVGREKKSFILNYTPVNVENNMVSSILELEETSDMIKNVYRIIGGEGIITFDEIIGKSREIESVKNLAKSIAKSSSSVLLRGDSGTGKELFARSIHSESDRKHKPFVAVNCASIPDNLLESELFGYEGGAFTGAKREGHMGKFELAKDGSLFLDEIGDLPIYLQPKLLRVLQEGGFTRLGGNETIKSNFRLIAATNKNLEKMIEDGEFREDLYYRLNVIPIHIPALKDRVEDIELLIDYLLKKYCRILNKDEKSMSQATIDRLKEYAWPGNVRELENTLEYLVNISTSQTIDVASLPVNIRNHSQKTDSLQLDLTKGSLQESLASFEKSLLLNYLDEYGRRTEDKERISNLLDINLSTLYRKLSKYDLQ